MTKKVLGNLNFDKMAAKNNTTMRQGDVTPMHVWKFPNHEKMLVSCFLLTYDAPECYLIRPIKFHPDSITTCISMKHGESGLMVGGASLSAGVTELIR